MTQSVNPFDLVEKKYSRIPKLSSKQEFWDTDKSYSIFYKYLQLGPDRRLHDVWLEDEKYKEGKPVPSTWKNWKRVNRWDERCEEYDQEQLEIENTVRKEVLIKQQEKDLEALKTYQKTTSLVLKSTSVILLKKFNKWAKSIEFENMEVREALLTFKALSDAIELSEDLMAKSMGLEEIMELIASETEDDE